MTHKAAVRWIVVLGTVLLLSGCFKDLTGSKSSTASIPEPTASAPSTPTTTNSKPSIQGSPTTVIVQGEAYSFQPTASDPDGDTLTFSISNKPSWAAFDTSTGKLSGTPGGGDVGTYANISISVSDGTASSQLAAFTVTVEQIATGSATLSWTPPTTNTDGTSLTDLAGYKIYYGTSSASLDKVVTINQPGVSTYVIGNLSPATWYFSMTSVNSSGVESNPTAVVSKSVS